MAILVTGGTGFIGSHTVIELMQADYDVVILDNLCNSSLNILPRLHHILGKDVAFYKGDIRDRSLLKKIFADILGYEVQELRRGSDEFIGYGNNPQFRVFALNLPKNELGVIVECDEETVENI